MNFDGRHREIIHIKKNIANGCTNVAMLVAFFNGRIVASFPRNVGRMNYLTYKYIYIYISLMGLDIRGNIQGRIDYAGF